MPPDSPDVTMLLLSRVRLDGGTQSRARLDEEVVADYAARLGEGAEFPPVVAYHDGTHHWLASGFHRWHAHQQAKRRYIQARVIAGTRRDAVLCSVGTNAQHGLQRNAADKRHAVGLLLGDEEWVGWSDREIARRCAVSPTLVGEVRRSLSTADSEEGEQRTYTTKHGTPSTMRTDDIGRPATAPEPDDDQDDEDDEDPDDVPELEARAARLVRKLYRLARRLRMTPLALVERWAPPAASADESA